MVPWRSLWGRLEREKGKWHAQCTLWLLKLGVGALWENHCAKPTAGITEARERKAISRASRWQWVRRDKLWTLDTDWELITLSRVTWVRASEVESPQMPDDPRYYHS